MTRSVLRAMLAATLFFVPLRSGWALGLGDLLGPMRLGPGAMIVGTCNSTMDLVTPLNLGLATSAITESVVRSANEITAYQQQQTVAIGKMFEHQNRVLSDLIRSLGKAQREARNAEMYDTRSRPAAACGSPELGRAAATGAADERRAAGDRLTAVRDHSTAWSDYSSASRRLDAMDDTTVTVDHLFGAAGADALGVDESTAGTEYIKNLVDPMPPVALNAEELATEGGRQYERLRNLRNDALDVSRKVLTETLSSRAADIPVPDTARELWAMSGGAGDPPGTVAGRMSQRSLLNLMATGRFGNEGWYKQLFTENDTGVLRDIALMLSVQLEIDRRRLAVEERIAVMLAVELAQAVNDRSQAALVDLRNSAIRDAAK